MNAVTTPVSRQLEDLLRVECGPRRIVRIECRPSVWQSSAEIHEIDVGFDDGKAIGLIGKAAAWESMSPEAQRAKPRLVWDGERERTTYACVLSCVEVDSARYYGTFVNEDGMTCLLLERVSGVPLWQFGEPEAWRAAARWLARLHVRVNLPTVRCSRAAAHLLRYDCEFYDAWMDRACRFHPQTAVTRLREQHSRVVDWLVEERAAFLHGEFYASNILAESRDGAGFAVRPLDWEMAAIGPPLVDLACLLAGRWSADQRADLADAYYDEVAREGGRVPRRDRYLRTLNACLIHVAVQNLGWSNEWIPPLDHAHDWLGDALRLSEGWR
jgi:Phosphotransferase enzyme family